MLQYIEEHSLHAMGEWGVLFYVAATLSKQLRRVYEELARFGSDCGCVRQLMILKVFLRSLYFVCTVVTPIQGRGSWPRGWVTLCFSIGLVGNQRN